MSEEKSLREILADINNGVKVLCAGVGFIAGVLVALWYCWVRWG